MKFLVGLGNPGLEYAKTRHNLGFILLDIFAQKHGLTWSDAHKYQSLQAKYDGYLFIKPQTFMNNSGDAVVQLLRFYKVLPQDLLVLHDDVDLEFGRVKVQVGGGSAGHHGIEDIVSKSGTADFTRIRFGVGRPTDKNISISDYVLSNFLDTEMDFVKSFDFSQYLRA